MLIHYHVNSEQSGIANSFIKAYTLVTTICPLFESTLTASLHLRSFSRLFIGRHLTMTRRVDQTSYYNDH